MPHRSNQYPIRLALLVLVLTWLVYYPFSTNSLDAQTNSSQTAKNSNKSTKSTRRSTTKPLQVFTGTGDLPPAVRNMRAHILAAAGSGKIEDLRLAIEWNELSPEFDTKDLSDPIAYFRKISADGQGLEILATLANILQSGYVKLPLGPDIENNLIYVWPYFAEIPLNKLSPAQQVELLRIVAPADFKAMMASGKYTGYRLSISADGTWQEFVKGK